MGSPENKDERAVRPLQVPTVKEVFDLLKLGYETKVLRPDAVMLAGILEGMKSILLPIISSLDQPMAHIAKRECAFGSLPASPLRDYRAVLLYKGFGRATFDIALARSGDWFIEMYRTPTNQPFRKVNSQTLAKRIIERVSSLLDDAVINALYAYDEDMSFLIELLEYAAVVKFIADCKETLGKLLDERERSLRISRERIDLVGKFATALDPLASGRCTVKFPEHNIYHVHERGTNVSASGYLAPEALRPFWEEINGRRTTSGDSYREVDTSRMLQDLGNLSRIISSCVRETEDAKQKRRMTARDLLGLHSGRLPLIPEEIVALRKFVLSLAGDLYRLPK